MAIQLFLLLHFRVVFQLNAVSGAEELPCHRVAVRGLASRRLRGRRCCKVCHWVYWCRCVHCSGTIVW